MAENEKLPHSINKLIVTSNQVRSGTRSVALIQSPTVAHSDQRINLVLVLDEKSTEPILAIGCDLPPLADRLWILDQLALLNRRASESHGVFAEARMGSPSNFRIPAEIKGQKNMMRAAIMIGRARGG